jgi:hypothetical protein
MSIAPGKVHSAISLVGYADQVAAAMQYVFSDTLICDDAATAKKVTFDPGVRLRSVTLEGDVYDPSGTLSGGAAPQSNALLIQVQSLLEAQSHLQNAERRAQDLLREDERSRPVREQWKTLAEQLEIKEHEVRLLEEQLNGSNASRVWFFKVLILSVGMTPLCRSVHSLRLSRRRLSSLRRSTRPRGRSRRPRKPTSRGSRKTWPSSRIIRRARQRNSAYACLLCLFAALLTSSS